MMVDTSLTSAIKNHIVHCREELFEATRTSSPEAVVSARRALEEAEQMPANPELFFEAQRAMYF